MRAFVACCLLLAAFIAAPARAQEVPMGPPEQYLAGRWAVTYRSDKPSSCDFPAANDQWWFEFRRSGGRALYYEGPDLVTSFGGLEAAKDGADIVLAARTRDGVRKHLWRLRPTGPDEMTVLSEDPAGPPTVLKRCGGGGRLSLAGVSEANLQALTPPITGAQGFHQLRPADTVADLCAGKVAIDVADERGFAQFELIGPGYFWLLLMDVEGLNGFSDIEEVSQIASDTLKLTLRPWGEDSRKVVTVRILADRIEIPEVKMTFARCPADSRYSLGMRRMG